MTTDDHYAALLRACLSGDAVTTRNALCYRTICHPVRFTSTPLVGARRTAWKTCLREWEWFMSGSNDINDLHPSARPWWEPWANKTGNVPFNYSEQFRAFVGWQGQVDQVALLIDGVTNHPYSRRNVLTTWNACDMVNSATPITNCHNTVTQAFVSPADNALNLVTYQRSADVVCGVPHNWLQMWAFLLWLARAGSRAVGSLTWVGGDCHVYDSHAGIAGRILCAAPPSQPELVYTPTTAAFRADDFTLSGPYSPVLSDRAEMVV